MVKSLSARLAIMESNHAMILAWPVTGAVSAPQAGEPAIPEGGVVGITAPQNVHVACNPGGAKPPDERFDLAAFRHAEPPAGPD